MKLNNTQQDILENWFFKQREILTEKIVPENDLRSWCIVLIMLTGEIDNKKFRQFVCEAYPDKMDPEKPKRIKISKNAIRQLLILTRRIAVGKISTKNYLYKSLTEKITDIDCSITENKKGLKFLIGVLFRANIASWMVEKWLEIMVNLMLPYNIWYLETMLVYLQMGIKHYYSEEKIIVFKTREKMVNIELCKIEAKLLGNIPKNIYTGENVELMRDNIESYLNEEYVSSDEEYIEFTFLNKKKTGYWTLKIIGSK
jgi:hypothetical protein